MKKETLKQQAYNIIKEKIINCEYPPSALLNEEMLKEDIQASRTPIRDALGRLEQEGLITILPKKGIIVAPLTIREINMVHDLLLFYITEIKYPMISTKIIIDYSNAKSRILQILMNPMSLIISFIKCLLLRQIMII